MTSSRPYLIRALFEWISDNGMTPYILVDAEDEQAIVPQEYVDNGKIVLNISSSAVQSLNLGDEAIELDARFSGNPMHIYVPIKSVLAIYARENGKGMVFSDEDDGGEPPPEKEGAKKRPELRVVK